MVSNKSQINRIGESRIMKNGCKATIVNYRNADDIDIQFEDGTIVTNKNYRYFKIGWIKKPGLTAKRNINTFGRLGESKIMNNGQLAKIIEYRKYDDIDIQFEDGYVCFSKSYYNFQNGNILNPKLRAPKRKDFKYSVIGVVKIMNNGQTAKILDYDKGIINVEFEDGTIVKNRQYSAFKNGSIGNPNLNLRRKPHKIERLGEIKTMNNGHKASIVEYVASNDISVRFDDGTLVEHIDYSRFNEGSIANPNDFSKGSSLQEFAIMFYLEKYRFDKLVITLNKKRFEIDCFNSNYGGIEYDGRIWHKNKVELDNKKSETFYKKYGHKLIHIREFGLEELDSNFAVNYFLNEDKPLSMEYSLLLKKIFHDNFNLDIDVNLERDKEMISEKYYSYCYHIGENRTMNNGLESTIIAYRGSGDIDVKFEDGTIIKNRQYSQFKRGNISNIVSYSLRIGEEKIMNSGDIAKIIDYRKATDIDVQFEDGTIIRNRTYDGFKNGTISKNKTDYSLERIGIEKIMKNGLSAKIIEYRNTDDIDVRFDDGIIVRNKRYRMFMMGKIGHPTFKTQKKIDSKNRIGQRLKMNCGEYATIINYRKNDDIDVQFDDGTIVKNRQYSGFKDGRIANPNSKNSN